MLTLFNQNPKTNRRKLIQAAGTGLLGVSLPKILAAEESNFSDAPSPTAKNVIFMHLFGGPSQLETFDMKPDAPSDIRGPFKPTPCKTDGLLVCEHLPNIAKITDKVTVVKTMTHDFNDHSGAGHYVQTGHRWHVPIGGGFNVTPQDWPAIGSVAKYFDQQRCKSLVKCRQEVFFDVVTVTVRIPAVTINAVILDGDKSRSGLNKSSGNKC